MLDDYPCHTFDTQEAASPQGILDKNWLPPSFFQKEWVRLLPVWFDRSNKVHVELAFRSGRRRRPHFPSGVSSEDWASRLLRSLRKCAYAHRTDEVHREAGPVSTRKMPGKKSCFISWKRPLIPFE